MKRKLYAVHQMAVNADHRTVPKVLNVRTISVYIISKAMINSVVMMLSIVISQKAVGVAMDLIYVRWGQSVTCGTRAI